MRLRSSLLAIVGLAVLLPAGGLEAADPSWLEVGDLAKRQCMLDVAAAAYVRALCRNPFDAEARAALGEVLLLEGRADEALEHAELGLASPRGARYGPLWRVKALALLQLRDVARARRAAVRGASLAPDDARVQEALARAEFRSGDIDAAGEAYWRATLLDVRAEEAHLRLGSGFGVLTEGAPWRDGPDAALFERALSAWDEGDFEGAEAGFRLLCRRAPDVYKYRLGLGLTLIALRRRGELRFGAGAELAYLRLPTRVPPRVAEIVLGFDTLDELDRHAICVAVAPAAPWLPRLLEAGATHEILRLDASIPDAEDRAQLADERTFDGRLYAHLRGIGGLDAATGVEKLREAGIFGFHTFAHEFAHQLHHYGLPRVLRREIDDLYARALDAGHCLDWYAASNVDEYFAQGYEAFVSQAKRGCLKETQRHTRDELQRRDPDLHAFFREHLDLSHETPLDLDAFRAGLHRTR